MTRFPLFITKKFFKLGLVLILVIDFGLWSQFCFANEGTDSVSTAAISSFFSELKKPGNQTHEKVGELKSRIIYPVEKASMEALGSALSQTAPKSPRPGHNWDRDPKIIEFKQKMVKDLGRKPPSSMPGDYWDKLREKLGSITGQKPENTQSSSGPRSQEASSDPGSALNPAPAPAKEEVILDGNGIVREIEFPGKKTTPKPQDFKKLR